MAKDGEGGVVELWIWVCRRMNETAGQRFNWESWREGKTGMQGVEAGRSFGAVRWRRWEAREVRFDVIFWRMLLLSCGGAGLEADLAWKGLVSRLILTLGKAAVRSRAV